jgi:hypothetical protein
MTIEFMDDFVSYYVNGAHPIAYADRPEVKQIWDDLLATGIIVRVIEPSDWADTSAVSTPRMVISKFLWAKQVNTSQSL